MGHYKSYLTSGEVVGLFILEIEVVCKLMLFIGAKLQLLFTTVLFFLYMVAFLRNNAFLVGKYFKL